MYFTKAILLLLVLHVCMSPRAQTSCTSSLTGHIVDEHGSPLVGAAILLSPGNFGLSTDGEGKYAFSHLCDGRYSVTIKYIGYNDYVGKVTVAGKTHHDFTLTESVTELNEVVVEHHDAASTEHASVFAKLDERKLAESAGKSLGETLKELPGVSSIQTGPGIFKPVIHGVHSQRLLILNHGIRQEGQQWGAEHAPEIDPFVASNIVVIKDASAIKYGADALGGVIVVNPAPLPETNNLGGTLSSVLQSNGRSGTLSGMLEGGIKNHNGWGWRIQGTAKRTGDFETPDYVLTNTGVKELNFSSAAGYHSKKYGVDVFFSRFQSELGILRGAAISNLDDLVSAMEREEPLYTSGFSYSINEPRQEVVHNLLKLNAHVSGRAGELRFQYGFQNDHRKEFDFRIGDLSKRPSIDLQLNTHSIDAEWETHHSEARTFSVGVNGIYQTNKNVPGTQRIPFIPNFDNISGGVFVTSKFFLSTWTIDAGLRYDVRDYTVKGFDFKNSYYSSAFSFNNVSASLGILKKIAGNQSVNLNVSTAWRPPHVSELYSVGTHQSAAAIEYGLLLDPETNEVRGIDDVEFATEQAIKAVMSYEVKMEKLRLSITPHANFISNYIFLRPEGITKNIRGVYPYFRYQQTDALFLGADVDVAWKFHDHFSLNPKASLLRARNVEDDSPFLFIPSNRYSLDLRYEHPKLFGLSNAYVESKPQFISRQTFAPRVVSVRDIVEAEENGTDPFSGDPTIFDFTEAPKGYFLWNVAAGFSIKSDKAQFDIRLSGDNILNQRYREYTNRFRYYADDLGRNITLSVKCIF